MRYVEEVKSYLTRAMREFTWADLRWLYIIIGAMIVVEAFVNIVMPHGWTIWPLIPVMGMLVVNEPADEDVTYCENCGNEPDPDRMSQQRTSAIVQQSKQSDRARKVLTPESQGNIASRKEKSLLAKSPRRRGKGPQR